MKDLIQLISLGTLVIFTSCVPSINPIYTEKDLITDQAFIGTFTDPESSEKWQFTWVDNNEFKLLHTSEEGRTGAFTARFLKVGGRVFLDIVPKGGQENSNDFFKGHFFKTHTFIQIHQKGRSISISYLDPEWLNKKLAKEPRALGHLKLDGQLLLTDTTENLQRFLAENVDTPGAFSEQIEMRRADPPN